MQNVPLPCHKIVAAKLLFIVVILLLTVQYFVNVVVYSRTHSTVLTIIGYGMERENKSEMFLRQFVTQSTEQPMELCPLIPPDINMKEIRSYNQAARKYLEGRITVNLQIPAWAYLEEENQELSPGGRYKPENCIARNRVAIIIPYRDREIHLKIFLQNIHPFLRSQQLDYAVFVVELAPNVRFNRAALMNIGFLEASKLYDYQCFIFHDVDLLPEDDRNLYICPSMPRHMSVAIDRLKYKLPYPQIFGGVSAISKGHFVKINGFSNLFFGWGGEDDDMYKRILYSNLTVIRYSTEVARYKMLSHVKDKGNPQRFKMLRSTRARRLIDGINSLKYIRLKLEFRPLYTWIYVTMNETEVLNNKPIVDRINAVQALYAKKSKQQAAKAAQKKKQSQEKPRNKRVVAKPVKAKHAQIQVKHAQSKKGNNKQNNPNQQQRVQAKQAQNQKPVLQKVAQNQKSAVLKRVQKQLPGLMKPPQFVSWVPTNASVPANLTLEEHLGPKRTKIYPKKT